MANSRDTVFRYIYAVTGDKELATTASLLVKMADSGKLADKEAIELAGTLQKLATSSKQVNDALSQKAALAETAQRLQLAKDAAAALAKEFDRTDTSSRKIAAAFTAADKAVADLTNQYNKQAVALAKTEGALQKAGIDTANLAAASAKLAQEGKAVAASVKAVGDQTKQAATSTKELTEKSKESTNALQLLKDNLGKIALAAAAAKAAFAAINFGSGAFKEGADVEQSLARVKAVADSTGESFQRLTGHLEEAARVANVSTTQAAATAAALAEQGQSADEIYQTLIPTLLLAKDANLEVAEAAGIVDDALDLFGKSAGDAALVVDQLVAASKGSKDGIGGLATAVRALAPDAKQLGLSFEQLVGLLGLMGQNGIDASKAAKGLRTVFQDLQDPTSKFSIALHDLGDSSGNFSKAIETIRTSGAQGQKALLNLDGSARSLVLFLLQQAPGSVDKFTEALQNAGGAAAATASVLDNTLKGAFTSFENALDRLGEGLLGTALEPFREEFQKLADRLNAFAQSPDFEKLKEQFRALFETGIAAFEEFISHVDWSKFITDAQTALSETSKIVSGMRDTFAGLGEALNAVGTVAEVVYRTIKILFDGLKVAVSGAVAGVVTPLLTLSEGIDKVRGSTSETTKFLEALNQRCLEVARDGAKSLKDNVGVLADKMTSAASASEDAAKRIAEVGEAFRNVQSGAATTAPALSSAAQAIQQIKPATNVAAQGSRELQSALASLKTTSKADLDAAAASAKTNLDQMRASFIAGKTPIEDVRAAFDKYAEAQRAAVANSDAWRKSEVEDQIAVQASLLGLSDTAEKAGEKSADAFDGVTVAINRTGDAARQASKDIGDGAGAAVGHTVEISDSFAQLSGIYAGWVGKFREQSQAASLLFQNLTRKIDELGVSSNVFVQADITGISKLGEAITLAARQTTQAIADQRQEMLNVAQSYNTMSDEALRAFAAGQGGSEQLIASLREQAQAARDGRSEFELLGAADLGPLAEALDRAAQKAEELAQKARDTKDAFIDMASQIQDEIDQINGDDTDIENRRHAKKLQDIKDEAEATGTINSAEYRRLVELENQLHQLKLKNLRDQGNAGGSGGGNGGGNSPRPGGGGGGGGGAPAPAPAPQPQPAPQPTPRPGVGGTTIVQYFIVGPGTKEFDQLAREFKKRIDDINKR